MENLDASYFRARYLSKRVVKKAIANKETLAVPAVEQAILKEPSKLDLVMQKLTELETRMVEKAPIEATTPVVPKLVEKKKFGFKDDGLF